MNAHPVVWSLHTQLLGCHEALKVDMYMTIGLRVKVCY